MSQSWQQQQKYLIFFAFSDSVVMYEDFSRIVFALGRISTKLGKGKLLSQKEQFFWLIISVIPDEFTKSEYPALSMNIFSVH